MTYFPTKQEMIYKCPLCHKWFIPGNVRCLVAHATGTCCHYGDTETSEPRPKVEEYKSHNSQ